MTNRRDRNGIFVSASDMFALLSIALLTYVALSRADQIEAVELEMDASPRSSGKVETPEQPWLVRFESLGPNECALTLFDDSGVKGRFEVPCIPAPFAAGARALTPGELAVQAELHELARLARDGKGSRPLVALCPASAVVPADIMRELTRCSQLQWTLEFLSADIEGVRPVVKVSPVE